MQLAIAYCNPLEFHFHFENKRSQAIEIYSKVSVTPGFSLPCPENGLVIQPERDKILRSWLHLKTPGMSGRVKVGTLSCELTNGSNFTADLHEAQVVEVNDSSRAEFAAIRIIIRKGSEKLELISS